MRPERLELSRHKTLEPKSSASANSATGACNENSLHVFYAHAKTGAPESSFLFVLSRLLRVSNDKAPKRQKLKVRWWHIVLIAFFVVLFLLLAYWQWTRFRSGSGTFQNLGYAFQWPLFAVFVVYAYKAALGYENERIEAENEAAEMGVTDYQHQAKSEQGEVTKIDEDFLPQRPQMDVETFNALNQQRRRRGDDQN